MDESIVESVALVDVAAFQTALEPSHAFFGRAMGKAVGNDIALRLFLQAVVADGFGGKHRFLNVFGFEDIVVDGVVSPNAGETVGLQFEFDGKGIGLFFADLLLHFVDFRQNAEQVLNVMADFMGIT